jgi:cyclopropane fatty-acyl-phospholipid synthase-like methyltransferase
MGMWKFFNIKHREHILCNPMSLEKLEQLITLLSLKAEARVLDIATGKGEFLIRLAEWYRQMSGTGVDFSPYCIADAHKK